MNTRVRDLAMLPLASFLVGTLVVGSGCSWTLRLDPGPTGDFQQPAQLDRKPAKCTIWLDGDYSGQWPREKRSQRMKLACDLKPAVESAAAAGLKGLFDDVTFARDQSEFDGPSATGWAIRLTLQDSQVALGTGGLTSMHKVDVELLADIRPPPPSEARQIQLKGHGEGVSVEEQYLPIAGLTVGRAVHDAIEKLRQELILGPSRRDADVAGQAHGGH